MPFTYEILPPKRVAVIRVWGALNGRDVLGAMAAIFGDEGWRPGFDTLWDFQGVSALAFERDDVEAVVERTRAFESQMGPGHAAFVVARDDDHLIAVLLSHLTRTPQRERRTFHTIGDALAWMARQPDLSPTPPGTHA